MARATYGIIYGLLLLFAILDKTDNIDDLNYGLFGIGAAILANAYREERKS